MDELTKEGLASLIECDEGPCISLYMPAFPAGRAVRQNRTRFKNLIRRARTLLVEGGWRRTDAEKFLHAADSMVEDVYFWRHQEEGLALFLSRDRLVRFRLPLRFEEIVTAGKRFLLKPLLEYFSGNGRFYLLALSMNRVRLFQGSRFALSELEMRDAPASMEDALKYERPESQLQFHTGTAGGVGRRPAVFHGQGVGADDEKDSILRYCRAVDRGVRSTLGDERSPLVFAGVDYLFPLYREANHYPALTDEAVAGNPDSLSMDELHRGAWKSAGRVFRGKILEEKQRFAELGGGALATKDLRSILPAAVEGRVDVLFVARDAAAWGAFDPFHDTVEMHAEMNNGDEDLVDLAAVHTVAHGGTVYILDPVDVPEEAPQAAILRYPRA